MGIGAGRVNSRLVPNVVPMWNGTKHLERISGTTAPTAVQRWTVMGMELENRMISAEWLKTRCYEICDAYNTNHVYIDRIIDEIDNAPDVEVVRCKDCKHYHTHNRSVRFDCKELYCCRSALKKVGPDDFCSHGERKNNV